MASLIKHTSSLCGILHWLVHNSWRCTVIWDPALGTPTLHFLIHEGPHLAAPLQPLAPEGNVMISGTCLVILVSFSNSKKEVTAFQKVEAKLSLFSLYVTVLIFLLGWCFPSLTTIDVFALFVEGRVWGRWKCYFHFHLGTLYRWPSRGCPSMLCVCLVVLTSSGSLANSLLWLPWLQYEKPSQPQRPFWLWNPSHTFLLD